MNKKFTNFFMTMVVSTQANNIVNYYRKIDNILNRKN